MKISELPQAERVTDADFFPVVQNGETKKANRNQILEGVPDGITQIDGVLQLTANGEKVGEGAHLPFYKEVAEIPDTVLTAKEFDAVAGLYVTEKLDLTVGETFRAEFSGGKNDPAILSGTVEVLSGIEVTGIETSTMLNFTDSDGSYSILLNGVFINANNEVAMGDTAYYDLQGYEQLTIYGLKSSGTVIHKIPIEYLPLNEFPQELTQKESVDKPYFENQPDLQGVSLSTEFKDFKTGNWYFVNNADTSNGTFTLSYDESNKFPISQTFHLPNLDTGTQGMLNNGDKVQFEITSDGFRMRRANTALNDSTLMSMLNVKPEGYNHLELTIAGLFSPDAFIDKKYSAATENCINLAIASMSNSGFDDRVENFFAKDSEEWQNTPIKLTVGSKYPTRVWRGAIKINVDFLKNSVIASGSMFNVPTVYDGSSVNSENAQTPSYRFDYILSPKSNYVLDDLSKTADCLVLDKSVFLNGTEMIFKWKK